MQPLSISEADEAEAIGAAVRDLNRARTEADLKAVGRFLADDYQLITPLGEIVTKEMYLGAIAGCALKYLALDFDSAIDIRVYAGVALVRYRSQIEVEVQGQKYPRAPYWFTDAYEKRDGQWQIVWSQGTGIA